MIEQIKELLYLAFFNSAICVGLYESTRYEIKKEVHVDLEQGCYKNSSLFVYKMFFWRIAFYGNKILGEFWSKPFYNCITCMASVHSVYVYWFFYDFSIHNALVYLLYIPMLAGINTIIANKIY
jgi:hypothetical protein